VTSQLYEEAVSEILAFADNQHQRLELGMTNGENVTLR
jgi:hypothetical protein